MGMDFRVPVRRHLGAALETIHWENRMKTHPTINGKPVHKLAKMYAREFMDGKLSRSGIHGALNRLGCYGGRCMLIGRPCPVRGTGHGHQTRRHPPTAD